jgi:hypothetical protein
MVTLEERVLKLYAETNPVPSVEGLGLAADEATEYLATFETRSSEVTQLKKRTGEQETTGRSLMPWLVAALLVLVVGVVALVTNEKDSDPIATTPTAIAETAANDPLADFEVYPLRGSGTFTAPQSTVPFALTVPDGWIGSPVDGTPARLTLCIPHPDQDFEACHVQGGLAEVGILRLDLGTIDDTREYLTSLDGAVIGSVEEVNVGGAEGIRFEYQNDVPDWPSIVTEPPFPVVATTGCCQIGIGYGIYGKSVVTLVDVAGTTMTLVYQGGSTDRGHPYLNGFEDHFDEGMAIIDSIFWGDLP